MNASAIPVARKLNTSESNGARTLTLVGRTGNGKSATANSILGRRAFKSYSSSSGVTGSCEMQQTVRDGRVVSLIDTPGLFDISVGSDFVSKEIVKCMTLAKEGIHAFLLVFTVMSRFSEEEAAVIHTLQNMFGAKIVDYMIIIFTGGDVLEEEERTLDDYLGSNCPQPLKEILAMCKNRKVLFDNKTKDKKKREEQVEKLLSIVEYIVAQNGGQAYNNEYFLELQKGAQTLRDQSQEVDSLKGLSKKEISGLKQQLQREYEEQLKQTIDKVEAKFNETAAILKQQLEAEKEERIKSEGAAKTYQKIANEQMEILRRRSESRPSTGGCAIL